MKRRGRRAEEDDRRRWKICGWAFACEARANTEEASVPRRKRKMDEMGMQVEREGGTRRVPCWNLFLGPYLKGSDTNSSASRVCRRWFGETFGITSASVLSNTSARLPRNFVLAPATRPPASCRNPVIACFKRREHPISTVEPSIAVIVTTRAFQHAQGVTISSLHASSSTDHRIQ